MNNNELAHYGVKGQKWYVRRYQNKDGTLTAAGKKRYDKEMEKLKKEEKILKNKQRTSAKLDKLESKKREIEQLKKGTSEKERSKREDTKPAKKSIKDMSDEELRAVVNRLQMEKQLRDLSPKQVSRGKSIASTIGKDIILPGMIDVGKQLFKSALTSQVNKRLNLDDEYKVHTNNKKK